MFQCKHCGVSSFISPAQVERDASDWILRCRHCGAKNILRATLINNVVVPALEIAGWREEEANA